MPVPFQVPRFYPILDTAILGERGVDPAVASQALIDAGARILQYRHKDDWTQMHFDEAKRIADACHSSGVLFVINDRADFARMLGAALHLGQHDLPPVAARKIIGDEVTGFSTHNRQQLIDGSSEPVEYLSLGPIFPTGSKLRPDPVVGLDTLRTLRPLSPSPLVAIGGIDLLNARQALAAGADSVAVIAALLPESTEPKALKREAEEWLRLTAAR